MIVHIVVGQRLLLVLSPARYGGGQAGESPGGFDGGLLLGSLVAPVDAMVEEGRCNPIVGCSLRGTLTCRAAVWVW
jgi:hypothetical protein